MISNLSAPQTRFSYLARIRRCPLLSQESFFLKKNSSLLHVLRLAIAMVPTTRFCPKAWYLSLVHLPFLFCDARMLFSSGANPSCLNWNRNSSSHLPSYSKGGTAPFVRHSNNHSFSFLFVTFAHCMDKKGPNSLPFL